MPPQEQSNTAQPTPQQDSNPLVPPGWVKDEKSGRYVPDDHTREQIDRNAQSAKAAGNLLPPSLTPGAQDDDEEKQSWLWKPRVSPEEGAAFWGELLAFDPNAVKTAKATEQKYTAAGQPGKASRAAFSSGAFASAGKLTSSLTSPGQMGLIGLTGLAEGAAALGSESAVGLGRFLVPGLRAPGRAVGAWFGLQGLKQMMTGQQEGESDADALERRFLGASAFLGAAGASAGAVSEVLVKSFGLDPELAAKVEERVTKLQKIRADRDAGIHSLELERDSRLSSLDQNTRRQIASAQKGLEQELNSLRESTTGQVSTINSMAQSAIDRSQGRISELERHQLYEGSQLVSDAVRTVMELEGDRGRGIEGQLGKPFREIGEKITKPLMTENDARGVIEDNLRQHGVENPAQEIPPAVFKTFQKMSPEMAAEAEKDPDIAIADVNFNRLTRIREDLYNAATASKDGAVRGGLMASYQQFTDRQETAAEEAGLGSKYRKAKGDWMQFKRSMGSGLMQDWLNAENVKEQDMREKLAQVIAPDDAAARAIRTTLKAYGVDTGPLDEYFRSIEEEKTKIARTKEEAAAGTKRAKSLESKLRVSLKKGTAEQISQAKGLRTEQIASENERLKESIKPIKEGAEAKEKEVERFPVIPGYSAEELAGKNNAELFKIKLDQMSRSHSGIPVTGLVMMTYGLLKVSAFPFLYGVSRASLPMLVKNGSFQDWLIEKSGISPKTPEANKLRQVLNQTVAPLLVKYARSGVPEVQAAQAAKPDDEQPKPPTDEGQP